MQLIIQVLSVIYVMDPLFKALSLYQRRKYDDCILTCTEILAKNPYDQVCILSISFTIGNYSIIL